jgi:hypothetical protein
VTHEYTLLVGGTVLPGDGQPDVSAIAWAADIVIALGSDDQVRATSRGDSHVVDLGGAFVEPIEVGTLEVGGRADLSVRVGDRVVAVVRGGRVVEGALPDRL